MGMIKGEKIFMYFNFKLTITIIFNYIYDFIVYIKLNLPCI